MHERRKYHNVELLKQRMKTEIVESSIYGVTHAKVPSLRETSY